MDISDDDVKIIKQRKSKLSPQKRGIKRALHSSKTSTAPQSKKLKVTVTKPTKARTQKIDEKDVKNTTKNGVCESFLPWTIEEAVADEVDADVKIVKVVINLLDNKCTIPFIARYRKSQTNNLEVKKLIKIGEQCEKFRNVQKKIEKGKEILQAKNVDNKIIHQALEMSKSAEEINHIMAPYKEGVPRSLADRALSLGLGTPAMKLLEEHINISELHLTNYIDPSKGLKTESDILNGLKNIITNFMAKDLDIIAAVRKQSMRPNIFLCSSQNKKKQIKETKNSKNRHKSDKDNFSNYYNFRNSTSGIKSHQVLAINRGERLKELKVTFDIPKGIIQEITHLANNKWIWTEKQLDSHSRTFLRECLSSAISRFIKPLLCRLIRNSLSAKAENASVDVFMENLKNLLLTPPFPGETIMAIDPGFTNGCKVAVTSANGGVIATHVIFPYSAQAKGVQDAEDYIIQTVIKFRIKTITIGNGVGCRQLESFISNMIQKGNFQPLNVKYCIIGEQGVSIYSISETASAEMPDLDPTLRSAVSLARRLQDPLGEYIKVDPKHLGIGMYQHDVSQKKLESALNTVIIQCVSFVGVDLNTSGEHLLKKVSGLNSATAKHIVDWRKKNGSFSNRKQLMSVKGIGKIIYQQAAGFVKILPPTCESLATSSPGLSTVKCEKPTDINQYNALDMTCIHPESYPQTLKLLRLVTCDVQDIGSKDFISRIDNFLKKHPLNDLCTKLNLDEFTLTHIIESLKQPSADIRSGRSHPAIFRENILKFEDIHVGHVLTGQVMNVTNFGTFVDIGIEKNGLIFQRYLKEGISLKIGHKVTVEVVNIDINKRQTSLKFLDFM